MELAELVCCCAGCQLLLNQLYLQKKSFILNARIALISEQNCTENNPNTVVHSFLALLSSFGQVHLSSLAGCGGWGRVELESVDSVHTSQHPRQHTYCLLHNLLRYCSRV